MSKYDYNEDILDELHEDLYESNINIEEDFSWVSSPKELEIAKETRMLEKVVSVYKEQNNIEKIDDICDKCIKKIIEFHKDKPIIVDNETVQFKNSYLSTYYAFVIMEAYDCEAIDVLDMVNDYKTRKKTK